MMKILVIKLRAMKVKLLTLFRMGFFGAAYGWGGWGGE